MDKKHLMRLFIMNRRAIVKQGYAVDDALFNLRDAIYWREPTVAKHARNYLRAEKEKLAALVETQLALKHALRTGKRSNYKKHGPMDANGNMHPAYKAFIENCKP